MVIQYYDRVRPVYNIGSPMLLYSIGFGWKSYGAVPVILNIRMARGEGSVYNVYT